MKTYSFLDSIKKQEKEVMLCASLGQKSLASARAASAFRSGGGSRQ